MPDHRGLGCRGRLARGVLELIAESGRRACPEIGLETNERFVENLAIYARRGYRETGRTPAGGTAVFQMSE